MEEALAALTAEETRLRSLSFGLTLPQSVLTAPRQEVYQPSSLPDATSNQTLCSHCKKPGHLVQKCYRLHPELRPASHCRRCGVVAATTPASVGDSALVTQLVPMYRQPMAPHIQSLIRALFLLLILLFLMCYLYLSFL